MSSNMIYERKMPFSHYTIFRKMTVWEAGIKKTKAAHLDSFWKIY